MSALGILLPGEFEGGQTELEGARGELVAASGERVLENVALVLLEIFDDVALGVLE